MLVVSRGDRHVEVWGGWLELPNTDMITVFYIFFEFFVNFLD
jgi:hypothetical protein